MQPVQVKKSICTNSRWVLHCLLSVYNIAEGLVSGYFGYNDESLALFGFGADSFIEAISGLGIVHMIMRIRHKPDNQPDNFEKTALKTTGNLFYILVAGLVFTSIYNIVTAQRPESTFWGIVISIISIVIMWTLMMGKINTGKYCIFICD